MRARLPFMTRLPKKRGITQVEEDKSLILRWWEMHVSHLLEGSHSGRVRASRTRVDESLEGSNPSSSAVRASNRLDKYRNWELPGQIFR